MSKQTTLHGAVKFKEITLSEDLTARILAIDSNGNLVDRPPVSTGMSTSLADGRVWIGNSGGVATAVDTATVGDIDADSVAGLTIKAGTIIDADINGSAAIAYSKLALTGSVVNADISGSAAIAYSKLSLTGAIVNADINASAAITRTKLATGTAYRLLANNASGVISENAEIAASSAVVSDSNGQLIHSGTTAAQIGYLSNLTGDVQTQIDDKIATQTAKSVVKSPTASEHGYAITWDNSAEQWDLTDPVIQGIPLGGSTGQVLAKIDGTDWNAGWIDLVLDDITDVSALADDLNLLAGADAAGLTSTHLSYLIGTTNNIQSQLSGKQSSTLPNNSLWVGNASNLATTLAPGTDGYVLKMTSGSPSWQPESAGSGTPPGADTYVIFNDVGSYGADAGLKYDKTTRLFEVSGQSILTADNSNNNGVTYVVALQHTTSGSPANGIGTGISFSTETSTGNNETGVTIEAVTTDVTAASEDFDLLFKTMGGGAAASEKIRISSFGGLGIGGANYGTAGQVLTSNGPSAAPSWQSSGAGTPPGADTQVLFNDGGSYGADAGLTYDKANDTLTIANMILHSYSASVGVKSNVFIGRLAGNYTLTAAQNTGVGNQVLKDLTDGTRNSAFGDGALLVVTGGDRNVCVGSGAGSNITTGDDNVIIGANDFGSGISVTTGSGNIMIGRSAALGAGAFTGDNNIVIGDEIRAQSRTASGQLSIQNIIFGTNNTATGVSISTGNIGIAVTAPSARLHLPAGTASVNTAPLKLTSGTALTTPENGAVEYHNSHLYFTIGSTRYQLDQQASSDFWTPVFTGVTNVTSTTNPLSSQYMRIQDKVHAETGVSVTPTTGSTWTEVRVSLPVASNFTGTANAIGVVTGESGSGNPVTGVVTADATNDQAVIRFYAPDTSPCVLKIQFIYAVA